MGNPHLWVSPYGPGLRGSGRAAPGCGQRPERIAPPDPDKPAVGGYFFCSGLPKSGAEALQSDFFVKKDAFSGLGKMMFRIFLYLCDDNNPKTPIIFKIQKTMKELVEKINAEFQVFAANAAAQVEKNNKAAGTRARKSALELSKLMKEFRKVSVEAAK